MNLIILSGRFHRIAAGYATKKINIVNSNSLDLKSAASFLKETKASIDGVVITEDALSSTDFELCRELSSFLQFLEGHYSGFLPVFLITGDCMSEMLLGEVTGKYGNFKIIVHDGLRISPADFNKAFDELVELKQSGPYSTPKQKHEPQSKKLEYGGEKKTTFLDRFRPKPQKAHVLEGSNALAKELEMIGKGISRIVAVTGHRGSGLTGTVVNLAHEAAKRGLNTIIIDLDLEYRSTNIYFNSFNEYSQKDEDVSACLIRSLARPQEYMTTAFNIKENLWLASLGYHFNDRKLIEQFYNSSKLVGLMSVLRNKFNLILLDIPMELFRIFGEAMIHIDVFGLCVSNNLYSVLSTLRNIEVVMSVQNALYLNSKAKVIVTKYNDRSRFQEEVFIPEKVCEMLSSGLSEHFRYEVKCAGHVPYHNEYDVQIETDIPFTNTRTEYEKAFGSILLRLMEGAK